MAERIRSDFLPQHLQRVMENFSPSEKTAKPIKAFETTLIVSLEEAVDSLVSHVPDTKQMVSKVNWECGCACAWRYISDLHPFTPTSTLVRWQRNYYKKRKSYWIRSFNFVIFMFEQKSNDWSFFLRQIIACCFYNKWNQFSVCILYCHIVRNFSQL